MKAASIYAIFLFAFLTSCADRSGSAFSSANSSAAPAVETEAGVLADAGQEHTATAVANLQGGGGGGGRRDQQVLKQNISLAKASSAAIDPVSSDRRIIRNADMNLESDDPETSQQKITSIAEAKGGFVVESQQSSSDIKSTTRDTVAMTVRVPSDRFNEALAEIRSAATRVVVETVKGQDVTEEFIDIEAQLKAKKALELQFMEIMKRANTVDDALSVQNQLAEVRGEIERVEGRKRFLENQSSLSTIKIRLQTPKVFAAESRGFGSRLNEAFGSGLDVAMGFILGFVTFIIAAIPFAMLIGLPSFLVIRYVLKRQGRPRSVTEIADEEVAST